MMKNMALVDEYENQANPNGYSLRNTQKRIERVEKEKTKPINPNAVFDGTKKFKNPKGKYRSPAPKQGKPIKEWL